MSENIKQKTIGSQECAELLGVDRSTIHRWIKIGTLVGEQFHDGGDYIIPVNQEKLKPFLTESEEPNENHES